MGVSCILASLFKSTRYS